MDELVFGVDSRTDFEKDQNPRALLVRIRLSRPARRRLPGNPFEIHPPMQRPRSCRGQPMIRLGLPLISHPKRLPKLLFLGGRRENADLVNRVVAQAGATRAKWGPGRKSASDLDQLPRNPVAFADQFQFHEQGRASGIVSWIRQNLLAASSNPLLSTTLDTTYRNHRSSSASLTQAATVTSNPVFTKRSIRCCPSSRRQPYSVAVTIEGLHQVLV